MLMDGRHGQDGNRYRYSFNGMETDDEVKGEGNSYDFGARIMDPRIGRWLSCDRFAGKAAELTPFRFAGNVPIVYIDPDGNFEIKYTVYKDRSGRILGITKETIYGKFKRGANAIVNVPYQNAPPRKIIIKTISH
jgi:RHS repeat-associated protein